MNTSRPRPAPAPPAPVHLGRVPPAAPRARGGSPPPGAAGRPAAPAPAAPRPAPAASTPPAATAGCPDHRLAQQLPLPERVVGVLHRQRRPARRPALQPRRIRRRQVPAEDRRRPAVAGDVMHHHHQHLLVRRHGQQPRPHRHLADQVERVLAPPAPPRRAGPARTVATVSSSPAQLVQVRTRWYGSRPRPGTPVRSTSCRPITSRSAAPSAADVQRRRQPQRHRHVVGRAGALQLRQEPQPPLRERQRHPLRPLPRAAAAAAPRPARSGQPRRQPGHRRRLEQRPDATSTPSTARIRDTSRTASSECPPSAKKSSSTPTAPAPAPSANAAHSSSSLHRRRTPAGARPRTPARAAPRSSFPFAVSGSSASTTNAAGTMYSGSRAAAYSRTAAASVAVVVAGREPRRRPAAAPGCPRGRPPRPGPPPDAPASTASTSPSSTRNPRTFTCSSARPQNTSCPSAVHRARSPVRYIRSPAPERTATNRSPVSPARPTYPRASPHPAIYSSPATPTGTGPSPHPARTPGCSPIGPPSAAHPRRPATTAVATITVASVGPYA